MCGAQIAVKFRALEAIKNSNNNEKSTLCRATEIYVERRNEQNDRRKAANPTKK